MLKDSLAEIFVRDLNRLRDEINLYKTDDDLWMIRGEITNSGGNLCLHLIGNLNHFIGAILGQTGFVRDRDTEFSDKGVTREKLNEEIAQTIEVVRRALGSLSAEDFEKNFPVEKR